MPIQRSVENLSLLLLGKARSNVQQVRQTNVFYRLWGIRSSRSAVPLAQAIAAIDENADRAVRKYLGRLPMASRGLLPYREEIFRWNIKA